MSGFMYHIFYGGQQPACLGPGTHVRTWHVARCVATCAASYWGDSRQKPARQEPGGGHERLRVARLRAMCTQFWVGGWERRGGGDPQPVLRPCGGFAAATHTADSSVGVGRVARTAVRIWTRMGLQLRSN